MNERSPSCEGFAAPQSAHPDLARRWIARKEQPTPQPAWLGRRLAARAAQRLKLAIGRQCAAIAARLAAWCVVFFPLISAHGREGVWCRSLGVDQGLSQSYVTAITQDRAGFMWFGTLGGLNRWDGYEFANYTHRFDEPTSLNDSTVLSLHADQAGRLWVGSQRGLDCFEPGTETFQRFGSAFPLPDGSRPAHVEGITTDRAGRVWFASFAAPRLYRLDPRTGQRSELLFGGAAQQLVTALYVDHADRLWVAMQPGTKDLAPGNRSFRLCLLEQASAIGDGPLLSPSEPFSLDEAGGKIVSIMEDAAQRLWFGRDGGGLLRFDPQTRAVARVKDDPADPNAMPDGIVRSLGLDPAGQLWVLTRSPSSEASTTPDRLYRVDPDTLAASRIALRQNAVRSGDDARVERLAVDHSGVLWLGSNGGGLRHADVSATGFSLYRQALAGLPGLNSSFVRAICKGHDGVLWVGTPVGLNRLDRSPRGVAYSDPAAAGLLKLPHPNVQALCEDRRGDLWIGTGGGLAVLEQPAGRVNYYRHDDSQPGSLSDDYVLALHEDRDGRIWVGTLGKGLEECDPQTRRFTHHPHKPGEPASLPSGTVHALFSDRQSRLWVGTAAGLAKLELASNLERRFERVAAGPDALGNVAVLALGESPLTPDVLWLGTGQRGLCRLSLRDQTCRFYTSRNSGLPDDTVYGMLADRRGRLWLSTNRGLACYDPAQDTFRTYGTVHGLQSPEFNARSCFQATDGELFFGGVGGLNSFYPEQITDNPSRPRVLLTAVRLQARDNNDPGPRPG
jgi:ligand-binding sensor domain-containing protein